MNQIELLSPAKNLQCGISAINHGADAVYIGAESFGARASAGNSIDDIATLIAYAHTFNVKVYVALNTILYDNEISKAVALIHSLYSIGADAIIIQDLGLLECDLPPIHIHASTQLNNRTVEKVQFLEQVGFSQVVLARELQLSQITTIAKGTNVPLEFFIHGALCVCYSGQCYMSQYATNRSGNRGECSQMCRHEYKLTGLENYENKQGYFLSPKDFETGDYIEQLLQAGISSFKIEGRLKDETYVKNVTAYYRKKIDSIIAKSNKYQRSSHGTHTYTFNAAVEKSFSRGFTPYFLNEQREKVANLKSPKSIGEFVGEVLLQKGKTIVVKTKHTFSNGDGICFYKGNELVGFRVNSVQGNEIQITNPLVIPKGTKLWRNHDFSFSKQLEQKSAERKIPIDIVFEEIPVGFALQFTDLYGNSIMLQTKIEKQEAQNPEKIVSNIQTQLQKLGDSIFVANSCTIKNQKVFFIPMSVLNEARRKACEMLANERVRNYVVSTKEVVKTDYAYPINEPSDCRLNSSNVKSKAFFERHGITDITDAYEIRKQVNVPLMTTKHCIRFQLDSCPKQNKSISKATDVFIADNTGKYRISFDCAKCEMNIYPAE